MSSPGVLHVWWSIIVAYEFYHTLKKTNHDFEYDNLKIFIHRSDR